MYPSMYVRTYVRTHIMYMYCNTCVHTYYGYLRPSLPPCTPPLPPSRGFRALHFAQFFNCARVARECARAARVPMASAGSRSGAAATDPLPTGAVYNNRKDMGSALKHAVNVWGGHGVLLDSSRSSGKQATYRCPA